MRIVTLLFITAILASSVPGFATAEGTWTIIPDSPAAYDETELVVDADGNVWFSSLDFKADFPTCRFYRYDGESWAVFNERDIIISDDDWDYEYAVYWPNADIAAANDGRVWLMTSYGLSCYEGNSWTSYPFPQFDEQVLTGHDMQVDGEGTVWCGYRYTLLSFADRIWTRHDETTGLPQKKISTIAIVAGDGENVCLAFGLPLEDYVENGVLHTIMEYGIYRFIDGSWHPTTIESLSEKLTMNNYADSFACAPGGTFWGKFKSKYWELDGSDWKPHGETTCNDFTFDTNGTVWNYYNVVVYTYDNEKLLRYDMNNGLPSGTIKAIASGKNGEMWVATTSGIARYTPGDVSVESSEPLPFSLIGNYPNPFNPSTTIEFSLETPGHVSLEIYNAAGQKIRSLTAGKMQPGVHSAVWDGCDGNGRKVSSGVYYAKLTVGARTAARKMIMAK